AAADPGAGFASLLDGGEQQPGENGDDRQDHQQFDQGETGPPQIPNLMSVHDLASRSEETANEGLWTWNWIWTTADREQSHAMICSRSAMIRSQFRGECFHPITPPSICESAHPVSPAPA